MFLIHTILILLVPLAMLCIYLSYMLDLSQLAKLSYPAIRTLNSGNKIITVGGDNQSHTQSYLVCALQTENKYTFAYLHFREKTNMHQSQERRGNKFSYSQMESHQIRQIDHQLVGRSQLQTAKTHQLYSQPLFKFNNNTAEKLHANVSKSNYLSSQSSLTSKINHKYSNQLTVDSYCVSQCPSADNLYTITTSFGSMLLSPYGEETSVGGLCINQQKMNQLGRVDPALRSSIVSTNQKALLTAMESSFIILTLISIISLPSCFYSLKCWRKLWFLALMSVVMMILFKGIGTWFKGLLHLTSKDVSYHAAAQPSIDWRWVFVDIVLILLVYQMAVLACCGDVVYLGATNSEPEINILATTSQSQTIADSPYSCFQLFVHLIIGLCILLVLFFGYMAILSSQSQFLPQSSLYLSSQMSYLKYVPLLIYYLLSCQLLWVYCCFSVASVNISWYDAPWGLLLTHVIMNWTIGLGIGGWIARFIKVRLGSLGG